MLTHKGNNNDIQCKIESNDCHSIINECLSELNGLIQNVMAMQCRRHSYDDMTVIAPIKAISNCSEKEKREDSSRTEPNRTRPSQDVPCRGKAHLVKKQSQPRERSTISSFSCNLEGFVSEFENLSVSAKSIQSWIEPKA